MESNKKKQYKKPRIQEVKLVPEEAVLTNCKIATTVKNDRGCTHPPCSPVPGGSSIGS